MSVWLDLQLVRAGGEALLGQTQMVQSLEQMLTARAQSVCLASSTAPHRRTMVVPSVGLT